MHIGHISVSYSQHILSLSNQVRRLFKYKFIFDYLTLFVLLTRHDMAEIVLKLVLNTYQSIIVLLILTIVFSVLRITTFDYHFGISKLSNLSTMLRTSLSSQLRIRSYTISVIKLLLN